LKDADLSFDQNFKINFSSKPFQLTKQEQAVIKTAAGTNSAFLIGIAWLMMSDSLIQNVIREKSRNIKHQILISGSSLTAYWLSHYISDILFQAVPSIFAIIGMKLFEVNVESAWILFLLMIFANPTFIYLLTFIFSKEETGSLAVKMLYFVIGIIGPIVISVLQVIN